MYRSIIKAGIVSGLCVAARTSLTVVPFAWGLACFITFARGNHWLFWVMEQQAAGMILFTAYVTLGGAVVGLVIGGITGASSAARQALRKQGSINRRQQA